MKRKYMRRGTAVTLSIGMAVSMLAGCGSTSDTAASESTSQKEVTQVQENLSESGTRGIIGRLSEETESESSTPEEASSDSESDTEPIVLENASYVMIYNPYFYDEQNTSVYDTDPENLYSGDIASQILTGTNRAGMDDLEAPEVFTLAQNVLSGDLDTENFDLSGSRAGGSDPEYDAGDTQEFYSGVSVREKQTFTCLYEGENCYVWTTGDAITAEDAQSYGEEFDARVYPIDTETFGTARFTDNGGKINLLFYSFNYAGVLGFFSTADIFSSAEAAGYEDAYKMNTDHAIININSDYAESMPEEMYSTMAHEFQHLICASDAFHYVDSPFMRTWLNESMSAYAEDLLYPGIKDENEYNYMFYLSDFYRKGQSLYNFTTDGDQYIGAYGIVYLFAEYLTDLAGEDVFSDIHSYWRESYSADVTEEEAVANSVSQEVYDTIDGAYTYADSVNAEFASDYENWFSKLTLDFYLKTFQSDFANLGEYEDRCYELMQYNEVNPLDIEGGGRVFVQTQNQTYTVPTDADANLIYIGLDENFEIVGTYGVNE